VIFVLFLICALRSSRIEKSVPWIAFKTESRLDRVLQCNGIFLPILKFPEMVSSSISVSSGLCGDLGSLLLCSQMCILIEGLRASDALAMFSGKWRWRMKTARHSARLFSHPSAGILPFVFLI